MSQPKVSSRCRKCHEPSNTSYLTPRGCLLRIVKGENGLAYWAKGCHPIAPGFIFHDRVGKPVVIAAPPVGRIQHLTYEEATKE